MEPRAFGRADDVLQAQRNKKLARFAEAKRDDAAKSVDNIACAFQDLEVEFAQREATVRAARYQREQEQVIRTLQIDVSGLDDHMSVLSHNLYDDWRNTHLRHLSTEAVQEDMRNIGADGAELNKLLRPTLQVVSECANYIISVFRPRFVALQTRVATLKDNITHLQTAAELAQFSGLQYQCGEEYYFVITNEGTAPASVSSANATGSALDNFLFERLEHSLCLP